MLSLGIEASFAFWMASASDGLPSGSPPPSFAATVMARASLVNSLPRRASTIAFLCLIPAHLECPAMTSSLGGAAAVQLAQVVDVRHVAGVGARRAREPRVEDLAELGLRRGSQAERQDVRV